MRNNKGQILPFVSIVVLILAMFIIVLVNIAQIEYSREKAQIAADAAALTYMRTRASYMNSLCWAQGMAYFPGLGGGIAPGVLSHDKLFGRFGTVFAPEAIQGVQLFLEERIQLVSAGLGGLNAANAGASVINAHQAITQNGCKVDPLNAISLIGALAHSTGLTKQNITLMSCADIEVIDVFGVPVPIPIPPYKRHEVGYYYCRTWTPDKRNAQPPDLRVDAVAMKDNTLWAGSVVGLPTPGASRALASAKLYLDVSEGAKCLFFSHNGGFPRYQKDEGWAGKMFEPMPAYPKFDAVLVPCPLPLAQH